MRICILGAGALGSSIGGVLIEGGCDVSLVDKWQEHVDALSRKGLKMKDGSHERQVKARAYSDCREVVGPIDLVIVLVKSFNTRQAILDAYPLIGSHTAVLSLQNGLGNEEIIAEVVGEDRVLGGVTYIGGVLIAPGQVVIGRAGKKTYIGDITGTVSEKTTEIGKLFNQCGLETIITDDISRVIWDKLLVNIAVGPLSAITRLPHIELIKVKEVRECALNAVAEAVAVAEAGGIKLSVKDPLKILERATEGLPPEHKSSMLQDIEKGSTTEIDAINNAVVRQGDKYNVVTPVNKTLVASVKGIEYQQKMAR